MCKNFFAALPEVNVANNILTNVLGRSVIAAKPDAVRNLLCTGINRAANSVAETSVVKANSFTLIKAVATSNAALNPILITRGSSMN